MPADPNCPDCRATTSASGCWRHVNGITELAAPLDQTIDASPCRLRGELTETVVHAGEAKTRIVPMPGEVWLRDSTQNPCIITKITRGRISWVEPGLDSLRGTRRSSVTPARR